VTGPRLGLSYFGNRYPHHARRDVQEIAATGATIVDHVMSEADLRWNPGTIAELVAIGHELGLENWLCPWALGGVFGGEASSYAVMEFPDQCQQDNNGMHLPALCLNQQAFRDLSTAWLDAAAEAKVDVVTWDEPHLALPPPEAPGGRWACRCTVCQGRFADQFGRPMPVEWDTDVATFCHQTIARALDFLIAEATARAIGSAIILLPEEQLGDRGWREAAGRPDVRYFGVSPYWVYQQVPVDEIESYLRRWCKRVVTATEGQDVQSLAWIQAFSVPAGREAEIERGMEIMREEGIEVICAWSYRACEAMSKLAPDNPALVWETVRRGFRRLQAGG
jgi:hypothetical protein